MTEMKGKLKSAITASCLAAVLSMPAAYAENLISAEDPDEIMNIAKGFGSARLKKDSGGDPLITGRIDGTRYQISFYGCDSEGKKCDDIKFGTAWSGIEVSLEEINEWNRGKRYGVAYLDNDGDPNIDMPVNIDFGVTSENLEDSFNYWTKVLKLFKKEILKK